MEGKLGTYRKTESIVRLEQFLRNRFFDPSTPSMRKVDGDKKWRKATHTAAECGTAQLS